MIKLGKSDYSTDPPTDISLYDLDENTLVVCPREGSKTRLSRLRQLGLHRATIVGWWDLGNKPVTLLQNYETIYLLEPERISDPAVQSQWNKLLVAQGTI